MSNKSKRESIIEACSKQIEIIPFVTSDGVEFRMADAYICPLCQHVYAIAHDALTLEHVPPESVGEKPILVTCKACNNRQGSDLDVYLMNELEISHNLKHLDTIPQKSRIAFNGVEINGQTTFSKSEGFMFMISPDNNNPIEFEGFMKEARNAKEGYEIKLTANITNRKRNTNLANIALLKSAYLMAFHELGYMYVLNPSTNVVREQILNPKQQLISTPYVIADETGIPEDIPQGVYYAQFDDIVCVVVVMNLQLPKSEQKHRKAVVLPNPHDFQCRIYSVLSKHIGELFNVHIFQSVTLLPIHPIRVDEKIEDLKMIGMAGGNDFK